VGVRIEDDVYLRDGPALVLTSGVPKEVSELESIIGTQPLPAPVLGQV